MATELRKLSAQGMLEGTDVGRPTDREGKTHKVLITTRIDEGSNKGRSPLHGMSTD